MKQNKTNSKQIPITISPILCTDEGTICLKINEFRSRTTELIIKREDVSSGKMKLTLKLSLELSNDEIKTIIMNEKRVMEQLKNQTPKKIIIVQGKIINIVH